MRVIGVVLVSIVALVAACTRALGPARNPLAAGTFALAQIDGEFLPIKRGPLSDRAGRRTGCDRMLDQGRLSLDPERRRYDLHYLVRSSCNGQILSETGAIGGYAQSGSTLLFEIPSIDQPGQFRGSISDRAITVQFYDQRMVFLLPGSPAALPMSGRFSHHAPSNPPVSVGNRCVSVDSVSLSLAPNESARTIFAAATGHFTLEREFRDSCTGRVMRRHTEQGSYEQIGRVVYFEAYPAPRTVRRFRGVILSNSEVELVAGGGLPERFSRFVVLGSNCVHGGLGTVNDARA